MWFVLTSEMQPCLCPHSFDLSYLKTSLMVHIKGKEQKEGFHLHDMLISFEHLSVFYEINPAQFFWYHDI